MVLSHHVNYFSTVIKKKMTKTSKEESLSWFLVPDGKLRTAREVRQRAVTAGSSAITSQLHSLEANRATRSG